MSRTVLLASYPMSGSTWLHLFIGNLPVDVRTGCPDTHFIEAQYPYAPAKETSESPRARGIVVVVRDPRDIVLSLAEHHGCSIDDSVAFMDAANIFRRTDDKQVTIKGWSQHVGSWLEHKDIPVHFVRYEDLIADPLTSVRRVLRFAEVPAEDDVIRRCIAHPEFREARAQTGHPEPRSKRLLHRVGGWRGELTAAQIARIESDHGALMQRLGYALSSRPAGNTKK